jgi:plasmid stability protein
MGVMVQVRNVPAEVHDKLKNRAKAAGMSLSDYLGQQLRELVDQLTTEEVFAEAERLGGWASGEQILDSIREGRAERDEELSR